MKQKWSSDWKGSVQPRKQRKYRYNAPLHVRHKLVSANLSEFHRKELGRRSLPVRKGDEIEVMRGSFKGFKGLVERVDLKRLKVYVENMNVKKADGTEVAKAVDPSNLRITKPNLDDKMRIKAIERKPAEGDKPLPKEASKEQPVAKKLAEKKETAKKASPKKAAEGDKSPSKKAAEGDKSPSKSE